MKPSKQELYRVVFKEYPDVMDAKPVSALLGVSVKGADLSDLTCNNLIINSR